MTAPRSVQIDASRIDRLLGEMDSASGTGLATLRWTSLDEE